MNEMLPIGKKTCMGCMVCGDICSVNAISYTKGEMGFRYPTVDKDRCIDCGACLRVCPAFAMMNEGPAGQKTGQPTDDAGGQTAGNAQQAGQPTDDAGGQTAGNVQQAGQTQNGRERFFAVRAKEDAVRFESSSGGVFPVLADLVFGMGGSVAAAGFNHRGRVCHMLIDDPQELYRLTKTKYVQSDTRGIYRKVKAHAMAGRKVLFVGTPCQTEAMRRFAGEYAGRILFADLVCYGVPSQEVWKRYKHCLSEQYGKFVNFSFRDKREADNGHTAVVTTQRGEYAYSLYSDPYCRSYFNNINIRSSCTTCGFAAPERQSDITLGDFWGIENVMPELNDGMGVSLVITHTAKGEEVLEAVKERLEIYECAKEAVMQPRLCGPTQPNKKRGLYAGLFKILPFKMWLKLVSK